MLVLKRDGHRESVKFDKITARIEKLCYGLDPKFVNPVEVAMKVINGLYDGVSTQELDNLAAEIAATMTTRHRVKPAQSNQQVVHQHDEAVVPIRGPQNRSECSAHLQRNMEGDTRQRCRTGRSRH